MNGTICSGSFCSNPNISSAINGTNHSLSNGTIPLVNQVDYGTFFAAAFKAAIYMSIVSVLTILANMSVLVVFMKDPMKTFRTPTAYFLVGIALADLATAAVVEPCYYYCFFRLYVKGPGHPPTKAACSTMLNVGRIASAVTMNVSFFTVLAFTLTQYLAIAAPMKMARHVTAKSVLILQVLIWFYSLAFQIAMTFAADPLVWTKVDMYLHNLLLTSLIIIAYALLFRTFRRKMAHSVRLQSESSRQTKESQARRVHLERKFLMINLFLIMVLIFADIPNVVWWFVHLYELVPYNSPSSLIVQLVIDCILITKFLLDPFVYAWRLAKYRTALRQVCCCCCGYDGCLSVSAKTQRSELPLALDEQKKSTVTLSSMHTTAD